MLFLIPQNVVFHRVWSRPFFLNVSLPSFPEPDIYSDDCMVVPWRGLRNRPFWMAHQFGSTETDGLRQSQSWDGTSGTLLDVRARSQKSDCQMFPQSEVSEKSQGYLQNIFKSCYFRNFLWSFTIFFTMSFTIQRLLGYPGIQPWLWRKLPMTDTSRPLNRPPSHVVPQSASTGPRLVRTSSVRGRRDGTFSDPLHGI